MKKLRGLGTVCVVFVFCAATAIASTAQTLTTLVNFDGSNGDSPSALIQATDGNFYGTTNGGGAYYIYGTIFKMTPSGTLTTLYSFCPQPEPYCADGASPDAGLLQATDGNFYGITAQGGTRNNAGTVFKITPSGTVTTLYSFCPQYPCIDGDTPGGGLMQATDGNLYGAAGMGGVYNNGTLFKITPSGTLTTLYNFCPQYNCAGGASPNGPLLQGSDGNLYGTTYQGGLSILYGTVFKVTLAGALTKLYDFCSQPNCTDGSNPNGGLVQATDGNFYGTTSAGGASGGGTVFRISPSGVLTTLYSFCYPPNCPDGSGPGGGLVQATDGNFYGTSGIGGGAQNDGTVFKLTPAGTLTTLHSFDETDGARPMGGLLQATDGNLYGTTSSGGPYPGDGTVFRLSAALSPNPWQFVPVSQPCRAVDTRLEHGGGGPIQGGTFQYFAISGAGTCATLPSAAAYSMNVSVVPNGSLSYLTVWPAGRSRPLVSTLNSLDGRIKANAAIIPAGANGEISVFATNTTNVIVDVNGYFAPVSGSTLAFYPLTPCRIADTRKSSFPQGLGPPFLTGLHERAFPILSATTCNIPSSAAAYSLNFSVVPHGPLGYMTVWPTGQSRPLVSTLNDIPGTIIANAAIVVAGTGGDVSVYPTNDTDLIIDINGYFASAGQGGLSLYPAVPCRVIDTRKIGNGQPFSGTLSPPVDVVDSACAPPTTAQAYVFNTSVVPQGALGYLTLWPDGAIQPVVSTLNALDASISSNMAIVPTNNGSVDAYASGITQLILDISSYFAP